jgi:hypothetical protein
MRQPPSRHGWDAAPQLVIECLFRRGLSLGAGAGPGNSGGRWAGAPFHAQFAADDNVATVPSVYQGAGTLQQKFASRGEAAKAADGAGMELIRQRGAARLVDRISPNARGVTPRSGGNLALIVITRTAGQKNFRGSPK